MNTQALPMTPPTYACRLKSLVKRSARIIFLALLNVLPAPAQTSSKAPTFGAPTTINRCSIQLAQIRPLRGFRLGMTLAEFTNSFQGSPPQVPEPDYLGVRSAKFYWSEKQRKSADLNGLEFKFFDDRLYQMEATYSVGTEWDQRPWSDFAEAVSRGMGVEAAWTEIPGTPLTSGKRFSLDCGEVRFGLWVMEPPMSRSSLPAGQIATAFLTLTATKSEVRLKEQEDAYRQQRQQRDAERRRVFKP